MRIAGSIKDVEFVATPQGHVLFRYGHDMRDGVEPYWHEEYLTAKEATLMLLELAAALSVCIKKEGE